MLLKVNDCFITELAVCNKRIDDNLNITDFLYFDKDGFELNKAEQKFYRSMNYPIDHPILNHTCWQVPWIELEDDNLYLDHSMMLERCSYDSEAKEQLIELSKSIPLASMLLQAKSKWGFDFDLNAVSDTGEIFEVLHIEYDSTDYQDFIEKANHFEQLVLKTDWKDCASRIWQKKEEWRPLKGFEQNHWKARYLIGWSAAELLEKVI